MNKIFSLLALTAIYIEYLPSLEYHREDHPSYRVNENGTFEETSWRDDRENDRGIERDREIDRNRD